MPSEKDTQEAFNMVQEHGKVGGMQYGAVNPGYQHDETNGRHSTKDLHSHQNHLNSKTNQSSLSTFPPSSRDIKQEKIKIWKNVATLSLGFLLLFTAFSSLQNIQTSLNSDGGLGTYSLATIYAALVLSCLLTPSLVIKNLGCKWTVVGSMLMYSVYFLANFYATWGTLIPAAVVLGTAGATLWSAKCTYLTQIGNRYAELVGEKSEVIIVRFFGVFFMTFQTSQIWGNLISSFVLAPPHEIDVEPTEERLAMCGINYCNQDLNVVVGNETEEAYKPETSQVYMLCGIYLGCALLAAALIAALADNLDRVGGSAETSSPGKLLKATFWQIWNLKQLLLIPLTVYLGLEQAFLAGDFTKAFVTCSWGIHRVGFVMICYGVVDAVCSILCEGVVKYFGRLPLYFLGAGLNAAMIVVMYTWRPDPSTPVVFFVIVAFWGMADAIWQTQVNSLYGVLFSNNEEAAFANFRLWESIGFIAAFAYGNTLCIDAKLIILLTFLGLGMTGYLIIEIMARLGKKSSEVMIRLGNKSSK